MSPWARPGTDVGRETVESGVEFRAKSEKND